MEAASQRRKPLARIGQVSRWPLMDFVLVVAWARAVLRNRGPYPVIVLSGEQGSAAAVIFLAGFCRPSAPVGQNGLIA
jgi:hypothetical protein